MAEDSKPPHDGPDGGGTPSPDATDAEIEASYDALAKVFDREPESDISNPMASDVETPEIFTQTPNDGEGQETLCPELTPPGMSTVGYDPTHFAFSNDPRPPVEPIEDKNLPNDTTLKAKFNRSRGMK